MMLNEIMIKEFEALIEKENPKDPDILKAWKQGYNEAIETAIELAETILGWIPVRKGLPKSMKQVRVSYISGIDGRKMVGTGCYLKNKDIWCVNKDNIYAEVTAWKPFEKPYGDEY